MATQAKGIVKAGIKYNGEIINQVPINGVFKNGVMIWLSPNAPPPPVSP